MKSFSKIHQQAQLETWSPFELIDGRTAPSFDTQKKQIAAIFQSELKGSSNTQGTGKNSVLPLGRASQSFSTWQPDEMIAPRETSREVKWVFAESIQDSNNLKTFKFNPLDEPTVQSKPEPENKAAQILEQARLQAEEIILAAQSEADNILLQAQGEIDEQKKEAYQQGLDEAHGELSDSLKATRTMIEEVRAWETALISQGEHILVEMLKEISQKMFGEGAELDTNALHVNLNRIMEAAQGLGDLNIFLNPRDAKNLDSSWSEYQMLITGNRVKIVPSGKITRGGCFVKGEMGIVDGRVETQLSAVLKTLDEVNEMAD